VKAYKLSFTFALFLCLIFSISALAEVEWQVQNTLNLEKKPMDMAISTRDSRLFVLTKDGIVHVYNSEGVLQGKLEVGKHVDSIVAGPKKDTLILKSEKEKTVQSILVEFVHKINIEGSPYRGKADAPIVITVFNDYQ